MGTPQAVGSITGIFALQDADFIIRTSDGSKFRVMKSVLRIASPIFSDMFLVGDRHPPALSVSNGSDVADVTETSIVMDALLRYIYPVPRPDMTSLQVTLSVLEASIKYEVASATHGLTQTICGGVADTDPLRVYIFGCKHGIPELKHFALTKLVTMDLLSESTTLFDHPHFQSLRPEELQRIFRHRSDYVNEAVQKVAACTEAFCRVGDQNARLYNPYASSSRENKEPLAAFVSLQSACVQAILSGLPLSSWETTLLSSLSNSWANLQFVPSAAML